MLGIRLAIAVFACLFQNTNSKILNKIKIFDEFGSWTSLLYPGSVIELNFNCHSCSTKYVKVYDKKNASLNVKIIKSCGKVRFLRLPVNNLTELGEYRIETASGSELLFDLKYRLCNIEEMSKKSELYSTCNTTENKYIACWKMNNEFQKCKRFDITACLGFDGGYREPKQLYSCSTLDSTTHQHRLSICESLSQNEIPFYQTTAHSSCGDSSFHIFTNLNSALMLGDYVLVERKRFTFTLTCNGFTNHLCNIIFTDKTTKPVPIKCDNVSVIESDETKSHVEKLECSASYQRESAGGNVYNVLVTTFVFLVFMNGEVQVNDVTKSPDEWKLRTCTFVHPTEGENFIRKVQWHNEVGHNLSFDSTLTVANYLNTIKKTNATVFCRGIERFYVPLPFKIFERDINITVNIRVLSSSANGWQHLLGSFSWKGD